MATKHMAITVSVPPEELKQLLAKAYDLPEHAIKGELELGPRVGARLRYASELKLDA